MSDEDEFLALQQIDDAGYVVPHLNDGVCSRAFISGVVGSSPASQIHGHAVVLDLAHYFVEDACGATVVVEEDIEGSVVVRTCAWLRLPGEERLGGHVS